MTGFQSLSKRIGFFFAGDSFMPVPQMTEGRYQDTLNRNAENLA